MRLQMLGLCRFSYVGLRGYQVEHQTYAERRAFLYDPARLARRWMWFEQVALPGWLAQTDPDFTLVIMTGPDLPDPYLSRLHALAGRSPNLRLELVPPMERHLQACRAAIAPHVDPAADVIGHFRHDDDDAVAIDYVATARRDFPLVSALWRQERRLSLDYARGVMLRADPAGPTFIPRFCHNMCVALTIFLDASVEETALHYNHSQLARWMPGVTISKPLMFLRSIHGDSDSGDAGPGLSWEIASDALDGQIRRRFGLEPGRLRDLMRQVAPDPRASRGLGSC